MTLNLRKTRLATLFALLLVTGLAGVAHADNHEVKRPVLHHKFAEIDGLDV